MCRLLHRLLLCRAGLLVALCCLADHLEMGQGRVGGWPRMLWCRLQCVLRLRLGLGLQLWPHLELRHVRVLLRAGALLQQNPQLADALLSELPPQQLHLVHEDLLPGLCDLQLAFQIDDVRVLLLLHMTQLLLQLLLHLQGIGEGRVPLAVRRPEHRLGFLLCSEQHLLQNRLGPQPGRSTRALGRTCARPHVLEPVWERHLHLVGRRGRLLGHPPRVDEVRSRFRGFRRGRTCRRPLALPGRRRILAPCNPPHSQKVQEVLAVPPDGPQLQTVSLRRPFRLLCVVLFQLEPRQLGRRQQRLQLGPAFQRPLWHAGGPRPGPGQPLWFKARRHWGLPFRLLRQEETLRVLDLHLHGGRRSVAFPRLFDLCCRPGSLRLPGFLHHLGVGEGFLRGSDGLLHGDEEGMAGRHELDIPQRLEALPVLPVALHGLLDGAQGGLAHGCGGLREARQVIQQQRSSYVAHPFGDDVGGVAALQDDHHLGLHEELQARAHVCEHLRGEVHPPQRVPARGVEPRGNDDEVRLEFLAQGLHDGLEDGEVVDVAQAGGSQPDVDVEAAPRAAAHLPRLPGAREEPGFQAVYGDDEHARVGVEGLRGAVPVVHVPVHHHHPLRPGLQRGRGRHRHVVEETEPGAVALPRVVPRGPHERQRVAQLPPHDQLCGRRGAAGRGPRRLLRPLGEGDVRHQDFPFQGLSRLEPHPGALRHVRRGAVVLGAAAQLPLPRAGDPGRILRGVPCGRSLRGLSVCSRSLFRRCLCGHSVRGRSLYGRCPIGAALCLAGP
mmetsp:Transcript_28132/g.78679  ORF Transcript_28132/g.78679 Transcript_28132/m.78679 type:complete len:778 (+) Transcript_28132:1066-3399(+)